MFLLDSFGAYLDVVTSRALPLSPPKATLSMFTVYCEIRQLT